MHAVLGVLVDPILAVFAILAFGFVLGRQNVTDLAEATVLNRFAMTVLLPIYVFDVIARADQVAPPSPDLPSPASAHGAARQSDEPAN